VKRLRTKAVMLCELPGLSDKRRDVVVGTFMTIIEREDLNNGGKMCVSSTLRTVTLLTL
jgi:hypothetical protein